MTIKRLFTKGLLLSMVLTFALFSGTSAMAQDTKVKLADTVTTALEYSPRLQVLQANQEAIGAWKARFASLSCSTTARKPGAW